MSSNFKHGGYAASGLEAIDVVSPFRYLFENEANDPDKLLPADDPAAVIASLKELADAMVEVADDPSRDASMPPVYTYWGQFIDHDITATDNRNLLPRDILNPAGFAPVAPADALSNIHNKRRPKLDLDSLYGDGPGENAEADSFYIDGVRFRIGDTGDTSFGVVPDPSLGRARDLPRDAAGAAQIGDGRNDENLVVAQFHLSWMRFHNAVADWVEANENRTGSGLFWRANQIVRHTYQWLVVNDFLRTLTINGMVDKVLYGERRFFRPEDHGEHMPMEFAHAAYRYGHSMVRGRYDYNVNFGRSDDGTVDGNTSFGLLFFFTGGGGGAVPELPFNWIIEWDRFTDHYTDFIDRRARRIDVNLAVPLARMSNELGALDGNGTPDQNRIIQHLAMRNLLRGYLLSIPTGQAMAEAMGLTPLSAEEMRSGNSSIMNDVLDNSGFIDRTPAWYYILKEAEVQCNGQALGEVGSRIIIETMIGLLQTDENSYLNAGWDPSQGVKFPNGDPITGIMDVMRFGGVAL